MGSDHHDHIHDDPDNHPDAEVYPDSQRVVLMSFRTRALGIAAALAIATPFVAKHEGFSPSAYKDPIGKPTICYGHTAGVVIGQVKSKAECDLLLALDLDEAFQALDRHVKVPLKNETRVALSSFIFNVGTGGFAASTALKRINVGNIRGGCEALATKIFDKYGICRGYGCGWSDGKMLKGLQTRRIAERELCLKGT